MHARSCVNDKKHCKRAVGVKDAVLRVYLRSCMNADGVQGFMFGYKMAVVSRNL